MDLCPRGVELKEAASSADRTFKSSIVQFFSNPKKDDQQMHQLEALGACQRDADEAFLRHQQACRVCGQVHGATVHQSGDD